MIIVTQDLLEAIPFEQLRHINVNRGGGKRILGDFANVQVAPVAIAEYDSKKKTETAFGMFLSAISAGQEMFTFPANDDPQLSTVMQGTKMTRGYKMTGKTK